MSIDFDLIFINLDNCNTFELFFTSFDFGNVYQGTKYWNRRIYE